MNPIEEHAWRNEAIRKEMQYSKINENFTLNPNSCKNHLVVLLTEKPNKTGLLRAKDNHDEGLTEEMKDRLMKVTAIPKAKNQYPATSNQEVGWDADLVRTM